MASSPASDRGWRLHSDRAVPDVRVPRRDVDVTAISMLAHFAIGAARGMFGRGVWASGRDMFVDRPGRVAAVGYAIGELITKFL